MFLPHLFVAVGHALAPQQQALLAGDAVDRKLGDLQPQDDDGPQQAEDQLLAAVMNVLGADADEADALLVGQGVERGVDVLEGVDLHPTLLVGEGHFYP